MNCFHVYQRLLLIFVFLIVTTIAKTKVESFSPSPPIPGSSPNLVPEPRKYFSLSSMFRSLIQVNVQHSHPTGPQGGGHGRKLHVKIKLSHQSDAPAEEPVSSSPGPSPILQPVISPVNSHRNLPLSLVSYAPDSSSPVPSPTLQPPVSSSSPINSEPALSPKSLFLRSYASRFVSGPGPSINLQPVSSSPINPEPASLPVTLTSGSEESPEGPDGDRSQETQSNESDMAAAKEEEEEEEMLMDYSEPEEETGNAIVDYKKVCETTDHPALCTNSVAASLLLNSNNNKKEVSLDSVLAASINATDDAAKAALIVVKKLATAPGTPPESAPVFEVCEESYGEVLDNLNKAKEAHDTEDVGTMNTMLSAVISSLEECNSEFSSLNIPSPVTEFSDKLINMTSNCLAIVSLL